MDSLPSVRMGGRVPDAAGNVNRYNPHVLIPLVQNETLKILRRKRFAVVAAILFAIIALVTYSQYRRLRENRNRNWRGGGPPPGGPGYKKHPPGGGGGQRRGARPPRRRRPSLDPSSRN